MPSYLVYSLLYVAYKYNPEEYKSKTYKLQTEAKNIPSNVDSKNKKWSQTRTRLISFCALFAGWGRGCILNKYAKTPCGTQTSAAHSQQ